MENGNNPLSPSWIRLWLTMIIFRPTGEDTRATMYKCQFCAFRHIEFRYYMYHLKFHSSEENFSIKCLSCPAIFSSLVSFRRHLKTHAHASKKQYSGDANNDHEPCSSSTLLQEPTQSGESRTEASNAGDRYAKTKSAMAESLLRLKAYASLSDAACAKVAKEFENVCLQTVQEVKVALGSESHDMTLELPTLCASREFQKSKCFSKYLVDVEGYVEPRQVNLSSSSSLPAASYQHVSVKKQLQFLLKKGLLTDNMLRKRNTHELCEDTTLEYTDVYTSVNDDHGHCIDLIMYYDEVQTGNPIGPAATCGKLGAVYYTLGNFDKYDRSKTRYIYLALLFQTNILKHHDMQDVMHGLVHELNHLEEFGLDYAAEKHTDVRVLFFVSDNLAAHELAGLEKSFSNAEHGCRFCLAPSSVIRCCSSLSEVRTAMGQNFRRLKHAEYAAEVSRLNRGESSCLRRLGPLIGLKSFSSPNALPPDACHDILEGVARNITSLAFTEICLNKKLTSLGAINNAISSFSYGAEDKADKMSLLSIGCKRKVVLKSTAAQMWTALRLLPLICGHIIPPCDELTSFTMLSRIAEHVFAPKLDGCDLAVLEAMIERWLTLVNTIYKGFSLTPKFHYLLHYPQEIKRHGPPRFYWTMRFEQKHQVLKRLSQSSRCRKNIAWTYAKKHQEYMALEQNQPDYLRPEGQKILRTTKGRITSLLIRGQTYNIGSIVAFNNGQSPVLGVVANLRYDGPLEIKTASLVSYCHHTNSYTITMTECIEQVDFSSLNDSFPLSNYNSKFTLRHFIDGISGE